MQYLLSIYEDEKAIQERDEEDEAIATASRIPSARFGTIEVRPIWAIE
jgi:hypothetical protein